jgi:glycosyltransferase involved in cell wall biosynthesis
MNSNSTKRLLVVVDEMEVGGSQRQIVNLLTGIDRRQWQPELVYFRQPSFLLDRLRASGIPVHCLGKQGRVDPSFFLKLVRLLRQGRYDLVHAFSLSAEIWTLAARWTLRRPPPQVSSLRSMNLDASRWHWASKWLVLRSSAAIIANAHAAARVASRRAHVPLAKIDVVANGVALPGPLPYVSRQQLRQQLGVPEGRVFGLFVGRLISVKNIPALLEATAALPPHERPWLALAGEGPQRRALEQRIRRLGLEEDVRLLGERSDVAALMQGADFLVLCSHQEGLSNAVLEAMAAGLPVLASTAGGNRELIEHGRTGLLFQAADQPGFRAALARMCSDGALREELARHAREQALQRHAVRRMVDATVSVYDRCLLERTQPAERRMLAQP